MWVGSQRDDLAVFTPPERPDTHCIGSWVGPRVVLEGCGISDPTGIRSPDRPARSESLYELRYPGPYIYIYIYLFIYLFIYYINVFLTMGSGSFPVVKRPERDLNYVPPSRAEVKGTVGLPSTPLCAFMVYGLNLKYRAIPTYTHNYIYIYIYIYIYHQRCMAPQSPQDKTLLVPLWNRTHPLGRPKRSQATTLTELPRLLIGSNNQKNPVIRSRQRLPM
jgi:hypothetical protein